MSAAFPGRAFAWVLGAVAQGHTNIVNILGTVCYSVRVVLTTTGGTGCQADGV